MDLEEVSEKQIVKQIKKYLERVYPGVWYKIHGGPYQEAGIPDLVGVHNGRFYAFEVKRPSREHRVSLSQKYQIDRLNKAGALAGVVTSVDDIKLLMNPPK